MTQTISAVLDDETLRNLAKINPENRTEAIRTCSKGYLDSLDPDTPDWYFSREEINPQNVYKFLRSIRHSKEAGRYANGIYRKADDRTKAYIGEMCDPESPIYIEEIAESLKDHIELHDIRKEIEASRNALNKLKTEVTERTDTLEELVKKEEESTKILNVMNEEIKTYNSDMYRIGTYRPIDALRQILDVLKVLGDNKLPDRSEIISNYKVLNEVRKARDIAQSLWDHYTSFDSTKIGEIAERQKVDMVNEAEYIEDKTFRKHYKRLMEALQTIRQVNRGDEKMIATGNYYLFSYDFDRIAKEIAKLNEIMDGADGGRK
ncbi:MAG: hypothetical protein M1315_00675 [Candidatus Thermoplasmatota archaeon]|nr:hypothetical protein [Candidatus Thermoplasmatota archaeon]